MDSDDLTCVFCGSPALRGPEGELIWTPRFMDGAASPHEHETLSGEH